MNNTLAINDKHWKTWQEQLKSTAEVTQSFLRHAFTNLFFVNIFCKDMHTLETHTFIESQSAFAFEARQVSYT